MPSIFIAWTKNSFRNGPRILRQLYSTFPKFYYPETRRPSMRNMELWKLIIKFRNEHSGKKLSLKEKELFYREAQKVLDKAIFLLEKYTFPITSTVQIAQISAAFADYSLALTVSEAFKKVGPAGIKMIVEGSSFYDELEIVPGFQISDIFINPMFIVNASGIDIFQNCSLVLYGDKVESVNDIEDLLDFVISTQKSAIFIFFNCSQKVLHDLAQLKLTLKFDMACVQLNVLDKTSTTLSDISVLSGTELITKKNKRSDFDKMIVSANASYFTEDELLLVGVKPKTNEIAGYISNVVAEIGHENLPLYSKRLETLHNNKIALIKIGGVDKVYIRKRMAMAVDSLGRAEQAISHGFVVGDGRCLLDIIDQVSKSFGNNNKTSGGSIVLDAMKFFYDFMSLRSFYKLSSEKSVLVPKFFGYDIKSKQYVNLIAEGIIYPKSYIAESLIFAKKKCIQYEKQFTKEAENYST